MGERRPNFLGIGAHKSGTTWLAGILASHPEAFVAHGKEVQFFSHYTERGVDWYLRHFSGTDGALAVGEYSVSYLEGDDVVAQRIHEFDPQIKLLACLRNPIDRAYSHYRWLLQRGRELGSFDDALRSQPALIELGLYFRNLSCYWTRFSDDQIHIVRFEDIARNPLDVASGVFRFVGVDPHFVSPQTLDVIGQTIDPRSRTLERARDWLWNYCMVHGLGFLITGFKRTGLSRAYRELNDRGAPAVQLSSTDRARAWAHFAADVEELEHRTGLDFSNWRPHGVGDQ